MSKANSLPLAFQSVARANPTLHRTASARGPPFEWLLFSPSLSGPLGRLCISYVTREVSQKR
jgi:hypothetical protein